MSSWVRDSVAALRVMVGAASVVDVGSSDDGWGDAFRAAGVGDVVVVRDDLTGPAAGGRRYDMAVSVGAGGQVPAAAAPTLVAALCQAAEVVVFAPTLPAPETSSTYAALTRHWWDSLFEQHGYVPHDTVGPRLAEDDRVRLALRRGLVVYAPAGRLPDLLAAAPVTSSDVTVIEPAGNGKEPVLAASMLATVELHLLDAGSRVAKEHGDAVLLWSALAATQRDVVAASYRPLPSRHAVRTDPRTAVMRAVTGALPLRRGLRRLLGPPARLWDQDWYLSRYPDVANARVSPLWHYRRHGSTTRRAPHPWIDPGWYAARNPDVVAGGEDPVEHYLDTGWREGREPHPLFHTGWYTAQADVEPGWDRSPLEHYLERGRGRGLSPHPLIDPAHYRRANPEVAAAGADPVEHFLTRGWWEGRDPHPLFDVRWYLEAYVDVAQQGLNPLVHYVSVGWRQGRDPHPLFDTSWYLESYPDVAESGAEPLTHDLMVGAAERRDAGPLFDTGWYVSRHPDAAVEGSNPLTFYVTEGVARGDLPSPRVIFDDDAAGLRPLKYTRA